MNEPRPLPVPPRVEAIIRWLVANPDAFGPETGTLQLDWRGCEFTVRVTAYDRFSGATPVAKPVEGR